MQGIAGIVFDLDGTLVSSKLDFLAIKAEIGCPPDADALAFIDAMPSVADRAAAMRVIQHHEAQDAIDCTWLAGAEEFVKRCALQQVPMAIMTRNSRVAAAAKIQQNNIPIDLVVSREDAPAKPNPLGLLRIAQQLKVQPNQLLVVGDYKYDLQVAKNAKAQACLINASACASFAHLADYHFSSFAELQQSFFHSLLEDVE